jgi:hypothetical protein
MMLKFVLRPVARFVRRLTGTDLLNARLEQLEKVQARNTQKLGSLMNALAGMSLPRDALEQSALYQQALRIGGMLTPMDVEGISLVRIGGDGDGGYVMLEPLDSPSSSLAYSFGVGSDVSWEMDIARRGIDVRVFDHTVARLPEEHPRCRFSRLGITGFSPGDGLDTLPAILQRDGNAERRDMLLKMDVEGHEWGVLQTLPIATLACFSQIAVEFHDVDGMLSRGLFARIENVLSKLVTTHQCVHVHANVYAPALILPGFVLPSSFECTFVNRYTYGDRLKPGTRGFPTALDRTCDPRVCDLFLGRFTPPNR